MIIRSKDLVNWEFYVQPQFINGVMSHALYEGALCWFNDELYLALRQKDEVDGVIPVILAKLDKNGNVIDNVIISSVSSRPSFINFGSALYLVVSDSVPWRRATASIVRVNPHKLSESYHYADIKTGGNYNTFAVNSENSTYTVRTQGTTGLRLGYIKDIVHDKIVNNNSPEEKEETIENKTDNKDASVTNKRQEKTNKKLNLSSSKITSVSNINKKTMLIKWNKVKGATGYEVRYRKAGAKKWTVKTVKAVQYTVKDIKANNLYEFQIRAVKNTGKTKQVSNWSNINRRYIQKVKIKSVKCERNNIKVNWNKDKKSSGYQIVVFSDKACTKKVKTVTVNNKNTVSKKVSGLKPVKKYYIRVRSIKNRKANNKKQIYYGEYATAKSITLK